MMKKTDVSFLQRGCKKEKEGRTRRLESFGQGIKNFEISAIRGYFKFSSQTGKFL